MKDFFVAGIGTSAGSLKALQTFFKHIKSYDNICYVIIQHFSSEFESRLDELLIKYTEIPIHKVKGKVRLAPGRALIMPSDGNLMIDNDAYLVPVDKEPRDAANLSIDLFFSSLAASFGEKAIGVVLAGTGNDGSRGMQAIHEQGGTVMVQTSQTAKSDGIPNAANAVAYKGSPKEIAEKLDELIGYHPDASVQHEEKINRLGKLIEESYSEIYIFDAQTLKFINVNLGARNNLGFNMEELKHMTPVDIKPDYTKETFYQLIQPLVDGTAEKISFETKHLRKDDSTYYVLVNLQLSTYEDKQVFIANIQDITTLMEARKQLQISEERLEYAVQGTSDGIWDWSDLKQHKMWWSPKYYELLGLDDQEIEGSFENLSKLIHPDDRATYAGIIQKRLQEEGTHEVEFRALHKTQGYRWYLSRGQAFRNEAGETIRMAGALSDIQDRKIAEFQYNYTYEMLRRANEYLDNIVFTVAHDLRSPVANLKSLVELFKARTSDGDPIVDRIDLSVIRLEQTLRGLIQILDVHQTESKSVTVSHFHELLNKLISEMESTIKETQADIQFSFDVKQITYTHPFMESIMRNLLGNAIKYARPGIPAKIMIHTEKHKDFVLLTVTDNGRGIDLDRFKEKIFKPFERLSNESTGQGIGLHLIKAIVEKNGGKVSVISKLNAGTTFKVYLKPYA